MKLGYRSKAVRLGEAMGAGLFSSSSEEKAMRLPDDSQSCIRSALRRRRRALGLTQNDAANLLGMSRVTYHRIETGSRRIRFIAPIFLRSRWDRVMIKKMRRDSSESLGCPRDRGRGLVRRLHDEDVVGKIPAAAGS